ncbi:MAG: sigma-54-dependent Fis family transcriptional regulator [Bacteroidales bacterium]|nr:sigma-54-dependent Fis family transcriptional regulator [Bacteroidales bacterium]
MTQQLTILVVDDEPRMVDEVEEFLKAQKFNVISAYHPDKALEMVHTHSVDIAILDIRLPGMTGLELLQKIKKIKSSIEVIMISGHGDMATVIEAMRQGAVDYFPKPFRLTEVYKAIVRTQRFIQLTEELETVKTNRDVLSKMLLEHIGVQLIGYSSAVKELISMMTRVAQTPSTSVLIMGESGTGKELVAHGIHYLSRRNKNKFYSVNCSAIPETLFESEFFGHKKGAFTGADSEKMGWFEIADKGTLFLDEISDLPLIQQAKLLRVLEEKKVSKLGSRDIKDVDVRVIAASNKDLEQMVEDQKFRSDLFHRLGIFVIKIPPLRDHKEDIPVLVDYYLKRTAKNMDKPVHSVDPAVIELMKGYDFPGNIRELRNIIERAVIYCDGEQLTTNEIRFTWSRNAQQVPVASKPAKAEAGMNDLNLEVHEMELIRQAMDFAENNKAKAASLLGISWQALDRRMKKYDME